MRPFGKARARLAAWAGALADAAAGAFDAAVARAVDFSIARRGPVLVALGLATAALAFELRRLEIETSPEAVFIEEDPAFREFKEDQRRFGADHPIVVAIEPPALWSAESLALIARTASALEAIPGVLRVTSLVTAADVRPTPEGIAIGPLIERTPGGAAEVAEARAAVEAHPLARLLVSAGGRSTAILVENAHLVEAELDRLVARVRAVAAAVPPPARAVVGGMQVLLHDVNELALRETAIMSALVLALAAVLLRAMLRRPSAVATPLLECAMVAVWTLGLIVLSGRRASVVTILLPVELMAIALSDTIHVYGLYYEESRTRPRDEAIRRAVRAGAPRCFFTCLAAAAGFLSLFAFDARIVREFGAFAAIGVFLSFAMLLTFVPALAALSPPVPPGLPARLERGPIGRLVDWVIDYVPRDRGAILLGNALFLALAIAGASQARIDARLTSAVGPEDVVWAPHRWLEERFGGLNAMTVSFETGARDGALEPDVLRRVARVEAAVRALPGVSAVRSLPDLLAYVRTRLGAGEPASLPETAEEAAQLLLALEMAQASAPVGRVLAFDGARTLIVANLPADWGLPEYLAIRDALEPVLAEVARPGLAIHQSSGFALANRFAGYLVENQVEGIAWALSIVTAIIALLLRSLRLGLLSLITNVQPMVAIFAAMGFLGIPITPYTVMVPGIAIGILVDDTIHALSHFRAEVAAGVPYEEAVARAVRVCGRASVYVAAAFAGSTSVVLLSRIAAARWCAGLLAIALAVGIVSEIFVLPKALLAFRGYVEREIRRASAARGAGRRRAAPST